MLSHDIAAIAETLSTLTRSRAVSIAHLRDLAHAVRRCSDQAGALEARLAAVTGAAAPAALPPGVISLAARRRANAGEPAGGGDAA